MVHAIFLSLDNRVNRFVKSTFCACGVLSSSFVQHPRHINSPEAEPFVGNLLTKHIPAELPFARSNTMAGDFGGCPRCAHTTGRLDNPPLNQPNP